MKSMEEIVNIQEDQLAYDKIIERLQEAKENNEPIDEGLFKAITGAVAGATLGPSIMKCVCKVLGISENGTLGNLMTSRLVLASLAGYLGWKN
jgi:hypothetical protein